MGLTCQEPIPSVNIASPQDGQAVSAMSFNEDGSYLAVGDKSGRITVYDAAISSSSSSVEGDKLAWSLERSGINDSARKVTVFQSHTTDFDYLRSEDIDCAITSVDFCRGTHRNSMMMLAANERTIKLWRVKDDQERGCLASYGGDGLAQGSPSSVAGLHSSQNKHNLSPRKSRCRTQSARLKRSYSQIHMYHINSVSTSSDGSSFLSADDLRMNWWDLEHPEQCMNILDLKPDNMEDLQEVITTATFHPTDSTSYLYGLSSGRVKLGDLRRRCLAGSKDRVFALDNAHSGCGVYSDIVASCSEAVFSRDGRYIVSRDYLSVTVWDVRNEVEPVNMISVDERLEGELLQLYESQAIFDKFTIGVSANGNKIVTGCYDNTFHLYDQKSMSDVAVEVSQTANDAILFTAFNSAQNSFAVASNGAVHLFPVNAF